MSKHEPKLLRWISKIFDVPQADISPEDTLQGDLGGDKSEVRIIISAMEDEFEISISVTDEMKFLEKETTVQDLLDYLDKQAI
jgi:acyl carrier protein